MSPLSRESRCGHPARAGAAPGGALGEGGEIGGEKGEKKNKRAGVGRGKCHRAERGLKGRGEARPTPLSARLWYQNGHFYRGREKKIPLLLPQNFIPPPLCHVHRQLMDRTRGAVRGTTHPKPTRQLLTHPMGPAEATSLGSSQCHLLLQQCTLRLSEDFTPQNYTPNPGRETEVAAGKD